MEYQGYRNQNLHHRYSRHLNIPFDHHHHHHPFISNPSIRHSNINNNLLLNTQNQNPSQESIDSLFSRLHVSDPPLDRLLLGSHSFPVQEMVRNHVLYSDTDLRDHSLFGSPRFRNLNEGGGISVPDSRGFLPRSPRSDRMPANYSGVEYLPLQYMRGKILSFATDQSGCRLVQRTIENLTKEEIDLVLFELIEFVAELMIDPFGNYVVQKIVEVCSEEQRTRILLSVTKKEFQLVTICLNSHGTRAVQKLLERVSSPNQVSIVMSALTPGAVALTKDMNGHHVIKYCLEHFPAQDNKYLLNVIAANCFDIATDKSGCCVLQQCVERSTGETRESLVAELTSHALLLAEHQFGNYVVQHILGLKVPRITTDLLRQLEGNFPLLACNKYGSNVVEKCLYESRGEQSTQIVMELLKSRNFPMLLVDPYGNFVIQAALSVSKGEVLRTFLGMIQLNSPRMRNNIYGQKVLTWLQRKRAQYM
ncbi:pumilio 11 [Euphorbia peplus]|nr:pumilio 11 [Euphorbia peplus]